MVLLIRDLLAAREARVPGGLRVQSAGGVRGGSPSKTWGLSRTFAPGHETPVTGDPGKSGNAPGDLKHDEGAKNAKLLAPGSKNPNKK